MFIGFIPHCVQQQWPCVLGVNKDKYSINSKINNKVNLASKLILIESFKKLTLINRKITRSRSNTIIDSDIIESSYLVGDVTPALPCIQAYTTHQAVNHRRHPKSSGMFHQLLDYTVSWLRYPEKDYILIITNCNIHRRLCTYIHYQRNWIISSCTKIRNCFTKIDYHRTL